MEENQNNEQALDPQQNHAVEEAQALTEMKRRNSELEAENAQLQAAKKQYYDAVLNGQKAEPEVVKLRTRQEIVKDMREAIQKGGVTNIEYAKLAVELNEACIAETGESCFLPKGRNVSPTADEVALSEKFPDFLKECLEAADGDPDVFNNEVERHTKKTIKKRS